MADESGGAVSSGKKRRLIIIGVGGVLVAGCLAFAAKILLDEDAKPPAKPAAVAQAAKPAAEAPKPGAEAPKPAAEAPKPAAEAPKPAAEPAKPAAAPVAVASAAKPAAGKPAAGPETGRGSIVIPGNYGWDARANSVGTGGDVLWQQRSDKERSLNPQGRAMLAITDQGVVFNAIGADELIRLQYSSTPIPGSDGMKGLDPGAVLGMRTVDGDYLKVRVVRYWDSHDYSFAGGDKLPPKWREIQRAKPKIDRFNVELEWVAYSGQAIAAAKGAEARKAAEAAARPAAPVVKAAPEAPAAAKVAEAAPAAEDTKAEASTQEAKPVQVATARPPRPEPPSMPGPRYGDVMTAVLFRDSQGLAEALSFGKWVDKPDSKGKTPLMIAVSMDEAGLATQLLDAGADASRGMGVAREFRNQKMMALMLKYGAQ